MIDDKAALNCKTYNNNYARAAAYFLATCAPEPDEKSKKAAYTLITDIYKAIAENSDCIGCKALPDVYFSPWEQQKGRDKDVKAIRDPIARIEAVTASLFEATTVGEAIADGLIIPEDFKINRALAKVLETVCPGSVKGTKNKITLTEGCAEGLKLLAEISRTHTIPITDSPQEDKAYLYFSRCVFNPDENWTAKAFDSVLKAEGRLTDLCCKLEARGYKRIDCKDGKKISLDYIKLKGNKDAPVKMSWADKVHLGIEVTFEELKLEPAYLWIRIPMFNAVLSNADKLPPKAAEFIAANTKTCDGCRYCVQTDKTGTRPLASISLSGKKKCPFYPSFSMNYRALSQELESSVIDVLDAVDNLLG